MPNQNVLLLTQSSIIAALFEASATVLQCHIQRTQTTAEAKTFLQMHPVSLVVVDQDISAPSAMQFLKDVNSQYSTTQCALILNTQTDIHQVASWLNQALVSLIFYKPLIDPRTVIHTLRETLKKSQCSSLPHASEPHIGPSLERAQKLERLYTLGEITNNVIHQFNNLLTIMNGHSELLIKELDDTQLKNRARTILKAGQEGARLTKNIQNFVRTSKNPHQSFDLNTLVNETLELTEPMWCRKKNQAPIEINTHLETLPHFQGNPGEIKEALTNLVLNAIDAMPQGGNLTVFTSQENNHILIRIADTGMGMDENIRQRIFEPYFTTKGENGNGLGLEIVSRIVHKHGGEISVSSQPNKGTCFTLRFCKTKTEAELV